MVLRALRVSYCVSQTESEACPEAIGGAIHSTSFSATQGNFCLDNLIVDLYIERAFKHLDRHARRLNDELADLF